MFGDDCNDCTHSSFARKGGSFRPIACFRSTDDYIVELLEACFPEDSIPVDAERRNVNRHRGMSICSVIILQTIPGKAIDCAIQLTLSRYDSDDPVRYL